MIPTPALDRIAANGLRYTNFNSTALCSPTRAALITGRNHHSVGFGVVSEQATGFPGYDSIITRDKATIGTILKDNGYRTSWFGKDHNTPAFQASQDRPVRPVADRHGLRVLLRLRRRRHQPVAAATSFRNTTPIYPFHGNPGWNLTTAMADDAIAYMNQIERDRRRTSPSSSTTCPGGTHAPHHPTPEWIKKISDMHLFDKGWNELRETIFANQKKLGVIPAGRQAHALAGRLAEELGPAHRRREEDVHPPGRRLRRLPRLHRPRDRPRDPGGRGHGQARQHADHLHQRRQRHAAPRAR